MKSKIRTFLNSPLPMVRNPWQIMATSTAVVLFLMFVLRPMGMFGYETAADVLKLVGSVLIVPLSLAIIIYASRVLAPRSASERTWTVGMHIALSIKVCLLMTICEFIYSVIIYNVTLTLDYVRFYLWCVLVFASVPTLISFMLLRNMQLKSRLAEANEINRRLMETHSETTVADADIKLTFANGTKETFSVNAGRVLYGEADGNYVRLHFLPDNSIDETSRLLRTTMKEAESVFGSCPHIVRCHRAFFVNVSHVSGVDGNSQGYRLHLDRCTDTVPVSRAYTKTIKQFIENRA